MKILVITPFFPSHPQDKTCKFIYDSLHAMHQLGYEIKVIVTQAWKPNWIRLSNSHNKIQVDKFPDWLEIKICRYLSFPRFSLFKFSIWNFNLFISNMVKRIFSSWQCDLIHVHAEAQILGAVKAAKKFNIPVVATIHGAETNQRYWRKAKKIVAKGLEKVNKVILVGNTLKPFLGKVVEKNQHIQVIYNGFDAPVHIYEKPTQAWGDQLKFISVSTLADEGKRVDLNLKALAILNQRGIKNWKYTIIGDGFLKPQYEALVQKLGLNEQVRFLGALDHNKIFEYLLEAHIFCLPSYPEAFGIAHLEAMACGLLVIGSKGQGPEAFITHKETGLLVVPNDTNALVNCLKDIFTNREKMQTITESGKKLAWQNFTWECHAKNLSSVYQELMQ